jgi:predicted transposase/invertase (TIGR01784 family)
MEQESANVHNPHDGFFKSLLNDRDTAIAFLEEFLPATVKDALDLHSLIPVGTTFVTNELKQYFSDIIFRLKLRHSEEECYISLLLEHKSYPDEYVEFQILAYIANGYQTQLKQDQKPSLIVPFVYYHGQEKWRLKPLSEYFLHYPAPMHGYVPTFDKIFISLFDMPPAQIEHLGNAMLRAALLVQRNRYDPVGLIRTWVNIANALYPYTQHRNFLIMVTVYVISTSNMNMAQLEKELKSTPVQAETGSWALTLYEQIVLKGKVEGKIEGKIEGKTEVVLNAYVNGLAMPLIVNITGLDEAEVIRILKENGSI